MMTASTVTLDEVRSRPDAPPVDRLDHAHLALRADVRRFIARRVELDAVEDLVQEVFLKVHESAGELRDVERLAPWLFRIARNVVSRPA